jgi:hypothetical protein
MEGKPFPSHDGTPAYPPDFFAPPDPRIGPVLSGSSSFRRGSDALTAQERRSVLAAALVGAFVGLPISGIIYFGVFFDVEGSSRSQDVRMWGSIIGTALVCAVLTAIFYRPPKICTYVGELGLQRSSRRRGRIRTKVLRFDSVARVEDRSFDRAVKGIHAGRVLVLVFRDARARKLFEIRGVEGGTGDVGEGADRPKLFLYRAREAWREFQERLSGRASV